MDLVLMDLDSLYKAEKKLRYLRIGLYNSPRYDDPYGRKVYDEIKQVHEQTKAAIKILKRSL